MDSMTSGLPTAVRSERDEKLLKHANKMMAQYWPIIEHNCLLPLILRVANPNPYVPLEHRQPWTYEHSRCAAKDCGKLIITPWMRSRLTAGIPNFCIYCEAKIKELLPSHA